MVTSCEKEVKLEGLILQKNVAAVRIEQKPGC
jgi:hypothetical protein